MKKQSIKTTFRIFLFGILLVSSVGLISAQPFQGLPSNNPENNPSDNQQLQNNHVSILSDFINLDEYDIEYSYNEDKAVAGGRFTLTVTLTNKGNKNKTDVSFEFDEKYPFEFVGDDDWDIENLGIGESVTKNFRIEIDENADSDDYELEFTLEDSKEDYNDVFEIEVKSNKAEFIIGNLRSDPTTILPDMKDIKLTVEVQNTGDVDAKHVKAKLELPRGFSPSNSYSDIVNLGTIKAGETKEAIFYIDTEKTLNSDLYHAIIHLDYENGNDKKSKDLEIDLPVQGIPQFSINSIKTEPTKIMQGDSVILKIQIKNIGEKEGKDTAIKVFEKSDQPFEFKEKTNYVGTLKPGETGTAVFKLKVDKDAVPTNYLLSIQIRTVYDGNVLVSEETIPINIYKYERTIEDYVKIGRLVSVGVLVILILLLIFKKNKIRNYSKL